MIAVERGDRIDLGAVSRPDRCLACGQQVSTRHGQVFDGRSSLVPVWDFEHSGVWGLAHRTCPPSLNLDAL